jgi:hypothetical protein
MHTRSKRIIPKRITLYALPAALVLLSLVLAACGGSSTASSATHVAGAPAPSGGATGAGAGRFAAVRECLEKNGIKLPPRKPGQGRPPGGIFGGGTARRLPPGVTRSQFEAAIKKCGGGFRPGARLRSPAYRAALASFVQCMRSHGINLPAPNTSGSGPIFNTGSINTNSAQFRAAESACRTVLRAARPGAGATPSGEASPQ